MLKSFKFMDLSVGTKFTINDIEFERIPDERISCCKILNCKNIKTQEKIQIMPLTIINIDIPEDRPQQ